MEKVTLQRHILNPDGSIRVRIAIEPGCLNENFPGQYVGAVREARMAVATRAIAHRVSMGVPLDGLNINDLCEPDYYVEIVTREAIMLGQNEGEISGPAGNSFWAYWKLNRGEVLDSSRRKF